MLFQHRHYKRIAQIISHVNADHREEVAKLFAAGLTDSNPQFDYVRFMSAAMGAPSNGRDKVRS